MNIFKPSGILAMFIVGILLVGAAVFAINFGSTDARNAAAGNIAGAADCDVAYQSLDPNDPTKPNPSKETTGAFGPAFDGRTEAEVIQELRERRACEDDGFYDPSLLAAHYADWSESSDGVLTDRTVRYSEIDAFTAELIANPALYEQALYEIETLESDSGFSIESVPAGVWTLYQTPNGQGGVTTKQGVTIGNGTNVVFTHPNGTVVEYRIDCGFQPNDRDPFPEVPVCEGDDCVPCPPTECLNPKPRDPDKWVGLGLDVPAGEFTGNTPPRVETDTNNNGVDDNASQDPASETGGQAGGGANDYTNDDGDVVDRGEVADDEDNNDDLNTTDPGNPFGG